jgi:nitrate/nitrite-specific signal transduction histidine kinase
MISNDFDKTPHRKTKGAVHIALNQVIQSGSSHTLNPANIDHDEAIRASVARELHDCLSELALLKKELATLNPPDELFRKWDGIINDIRRLISDLRPKMLDFGIGTALKHLTHRLEDRISNGTQIHLEVSDDSCRYSPQAEQHIYRIIQQACENALQHAHAKTITIRGSLESAQVDLAVEDDGVGFTTRTSLDLGTLVAHQHFGIAGMFERAQIINATITIDSTPGQGTGIRLIWQPKNLS